eukprot:4003325-Lingulodinium_polyedra.AAC.1
MPAAFAFVAPAVSRRAFGRRACAGAAPPSAFGVGRQPPIPSAGVAIVFQVRGRRGWPQGSNLYVKFGRRG